MISRGSFLAAMALLLAIFVAKAISGERTEPPALQLEANIPLGNIRGRIDHMAVDLARHRLFVAALGDGSLAVLNLQTQRLERRIEDLPEPQGVGYDPATDTLYVAN
jgi:DNA-binding beta-propeller fold protein YncE